MKLISILLGLVFASLFLGILAEKKGSHAEENHERKEKENGKEKENPKVSVEHQAGTADIFWDEWGVPHIFAENFETLAYAFGYAQARDHGNTLARMFFFSSGKAAEVSRFYSLIDRLIYSYRLKHFADLYYEIQDPETILALESFAKGFNAFAEKNPQFFDGDFAAILPLDGYKVFSANLRILYTFTFLDLIETRVGFEGKYGKDPLMEKRLQEENVFYGAYEDQDLVTAFGVPKELRHLIGSNAWAINSRSGRSDGKPKLVQNPHLPYQAFFRWYEAHLVCESCGINVYGASLLGIPNLQVAFNEYLGWTHTVNHIQPFTTYIVDLATEDSYYYDGQILKITTEQYTYRVKQLIGYKEETVINEFTIQGQIIARAEGKVLVKRLAGFDDQIRPDAIKQWWDMGRAKSLAEFKNVMSQLQIPMFYTVVTTRDDDIMINFNGWLPDRKGKGDFNFWKSPVNGSTSETMWTGIHPWEELPNLENPASGFVQNANEPPWTNTLPVFTINPNNYPPYAAAPAEVAYRPQVSLRLISSHSNITYDQLVALKHSTFKEATAHCLDDLLKAVQQYGQNSPDAQEGAAVLAQWDRLTESTSRGADLFIAWIRRSPGVEELYVNQWDPADPLNTPNTIRDPQLAVANLETAVRALKEKGVALDSQYGENNLLFNGPFNERNFLPGNGCADCFRSAYYIFGLALGGDSYVCVVEWDKSGVVQAKSLLGYGNATPKSAGAAKHVNDQNTLFAKKELRPVWRTKEEILLHLEEHVPIQI